MDPSLLTAASTVLGGALGGSKGGSASAEGGDAFMDLGRGDWIVSSGPGDASLSGLSPWLIGACVLAALVAIKLWKRG